MGTKRKIIFSNAYRPREIEKARPSEYTAQEWGLITSDKKHVSPKTIKANEVLSNIKWLDDQKSIR